MASVRNLKKDINYVLGDIIEAVYVWEIATGKATPASQAVIEEAIGSFDALITQVNDRSVQDKKAHFKQVNAQLETTARALVDKINQLA
ncbi:MAG TPA: hypothetical protein PLA69_08275 [Flavobacterium sp.]|nr:hypothetical protein [Flavobacterium sp.]